MVFEQFNRNNIGVKYSLIGKGGHFEPCRVGKKLFLNFELKLLFVNTIKVKKAIT